MPFGTRLDLTGLLLEDARGLVLRTDTGGTWRVEAARGARRLLGRRVRIRGTRDGFDLVAARSVTAQG